MFSALLLQRALHDNHLFRTELPNQGTKSICIARRALTNKRGNMCLRQCKILIRRGRVDAAIWALTRRSICETGSFRRSSSSLFARTSSSSNDKPPAPITSAKYENRSSLTFSSSDQSEAFWEVNHWWIPEQARTGAYSIIGLSVKRSCRSCQG
jgi:hypothetical protein